MWTRTSRASGKGFLTTFLLIALALAWGAVLLPAVVRARRNSPYGASQRFKRRMALISPPPARSGGRWVIVPSGESVTGRDASRRVQARRRRILKLLVCVVLLTLAAGLLLEGSWWEVHVGADFVISFYVAYLLEAKRREAERATKIRSLSARSRDARPTQERESQRAFGGR